RILNVFRPESLLHEIEEEMQSHIGEAIEQGRDPVEARRAFGSTLHRVEQSHDVRLIPWLDSLRADAIFGWRQILKKKVTSAAAILSLALAIGACTAAFRLIDALLLRALPVAGTERLYTITFHSKSAMDAAISTYDSCSYPMFQRMRADVRDQAESIAISMYNGPVDLTYGSDQEMEQVGLQYVSASMFETFRLQPAAGRLLMASDDATPGAHPVAVLSYEYWTRRFGRNPEITGRTFRIGNDVFEIAGVGPKGFTGTETGRAADVFVSMSMKSPRILASLNNFWLRTLLLLKPGVAPGPVEEKLRATFQAIQEERVKGFPAMSQRDRDRMFQEKLSIEPAASGRSNMQRDYRQALAVLGLLAALVLLIACANVANLMTAQAAARAREMALRVSIGAGRSRLVQMVLVESAWLAILATAIGGVIAGWFVSLLVGMINPPAYAARLPLPVDWRALGFSLALACGVTFLFGLAPALRASSVQPASALRGGEDPHRRARLMHSLIAIQVAFCFVVHIAAGLFVSTFQRLSNQPTGFSADRVLNVESVTNSPQSPALWNQVAEHLRAVPGVDRVAIIGWPLMSGESAVGNISVNGGLLSDVFSDFVTVSPGWVELMKIPLLAGREFHAGDVYPGVAIVNQAFAKQYFNGENPLGKWFERVEPAGGRTRFQVVGWVRDARSRSSMRLAIRPTAYIPFSSVDAGGAFKPMSRGTFVVRTAGANPLTLASALRADVARARPGFSARDIRTQLELNQTETARERLLAMLAAFFAVVALLLAGVGLYAVLDYSVLQRRREIGIRIAIGAQPADIIRRVTVEGLTTVFVGAVVGLGLCMISVRYVASLLYQVRVTDLPVLALPSFAILGAALLATLPAVIRAVRVDPVQMLRAE
ncbi:MAG: ABC transporter permease, partial [Bryobacteraceae bacterium]